MINFKNSDFCKLLRLCAISALQISKKHFATFDFFAKRKLELTVWVSTSLSKVGYSEALQMVSFENFVKSMMSCLLKLKVTPSFCYAFKIPDDPTASSQ